MSTKALVSEQLRLMNRQDLLNGLEFDRKAGLNQQVVTISTIE